MLLSLHKSETFYNLNGQQPNIIFREDCSILFKKEKLKILNALKKINYNVNFDLEFSLSDIDGSEILGKKEAEVFSLHYKEKNIKIIWSNFSADIIVDDYLVEEYGDDSGTFFYKFDDVLGDRQKWEQYHNKNNNKVLQLSNTESINETILYIKNKLNLLVKEIESYDVKIGPVFNLKTAKKLHFDLGVYVIFVDKVKLNALYNNENIKISGGRRLLSLNKPLNGLNPIVYEGFIYIQIEPHIDCLVPNMDMLVFDSASNTYPIIFQPKNVEGLYFYETTLNDEEDYQYQHSKSLIEYNKYTGQYQQPVIACVREIYADELSIPLEYYKLLKEENKNVRNFSTI